jgi:hypothetical protein
MLALSGSLTGGGVRLFFFLLCGDRAMDKRSEEALWSQLAGMLNLEQRLENSLRWQEEARKHSPEITSQLGSIRGNALRHIRCLKELSGWPAGLAGSGFQSPGMEEGKPCQHALPEDLALISLTAGGYLMLLTAARALAQTELAELAERHLRDHTEGVIRILGVIPLVVVQSLQAEGSEVRAEAVASVALTVAEIWRSQVEPLALR